MKYFLKKYSIFLYVLIIFSLSSIPGDGIIVNINEFGFDKILHFFEYFILGLLLAIFLRNKTLVYNVGYILVVFIPILDEFWIQRLSLRNVDVLDFWANFAGLYTGIIIYFLIGKFYVEKNSN